MKRTHLLVYSIGPNESDPEGDGGLACGLEDAEHVSTRKGEVTCKACLKASQPATKPERLIPASEMEGVREEIKRTMHFLDESRYGTAWEGLKECLATLDRLMKGE